jgi:hypothetical protein
MTEPETDELATRLKLLLDERLVLFAELNGEPVAFIVTLPNINEAIRDLNGRLFPFGMLKLLWRLKVRGLKSARVPLMGVRRKLAGTVIGSALPLQLIGAIRPGVKKLGFRWVELSWILENNRPMRSILERLGAKPYKTYRIYGKTFG